MRTFPFGRTTHTDEQEETERVLVVDDLPEICLMFKELLRRIRHPNVRLVTETNSERAVALVGREPFSLVISDFRMPRADGVEVLVAARARNPQGIRVLMTGYNEAPTTLERLRNAEVDAYLHKPLHAQELMLLLLGLLRKDAGTLAELRAHARELELLATRAAASRNPLLAPPPHPSGVEAARMSPR